MDHNDDDEISHWNDEERYYSTERDSDDSPLLSKRIHDKKEYRYPSYPISRADERERRSTLSLLMKFFLFCTAMIMFCVLLYIPVYNKASYPMSKATVAGWAQNTNRDTTLYVLPYNLTIIHEPTNTCPKKDINTKNKLLLLIVVCSATSNFDRREAIRDTWGNHTKYKELNAVFNLINQRYKDYNYTYDLYNLSNTSKVRRKREVSGISKLLPEIAKALQSNLNNVKTDSVQEKRFEDEDDVKNDDDVKDAEGDINAETDKNAENVKDTENNVKDGDDDVFNEFGVDKEFGDTIANYDYEYSSNIMKIPPKGFEENPDLDKVLSLLKKDKNFPKFRESLVNSNIDSIEVEFKLVFLLGLPAQRNNTTVQDKIEEEVEKYGDVIQEDFVDSYNNLTLKSIMMLKWINNNCNESVRYILKIDDDMYVNVPNLISNLKNRSQAYDKEVAEKNVKSEELLLAGVLIKNARPVADASNKWYSPRYMYKGRMYPKYLSGTGYLFSAPAAKSLYRAALKTPLFHLEDVYITGICPLRSSPYVRPINWPLFSFSPRWSRAALCSAHALATVHRVPPRDMRAIHTALAHPQTVDKCERRRLTQICQEERKCNRAVKSVVLDTMLFLIVVMHLVRDRRWPFLVGFT